jgi:hypothetical protein
VVVIMSRILISLLLLAFAVSGLALTVRAQQEEQTTPYEEPGAQFPEYGSVCPPDRILVKLRPGADPATVIGQYGGTIVETIQGIQVQVVTVPHGTGQQTIDALSADPLVQYAEADQKVYATGEGSGC